MGFQEGINNPILIHLLVEQGTLFYEGASIMVSEIESAVSAAQWEGEK
jgi:hypothetical protein